MQNKNFWIAALAGGLVVNIVDFVVMGTVFPNMFFAHMSIMNQTTNPIWYVAGDFVAAIVFTWVYDKVYDSFGGGMKGGMTYGMYAGVLMYFPGMIFMHLMFQGFPYSLSWAMTIYGIIWAMILGTVVGKLYTKGKAAPAM